MSAGAGRQRGYETTPGSIRSSPSKNRTISSRVRSLISAEPCWFQNCTAWSIGPAPTSVVGCEMTR
jgi:hypothetical protein